MPSEQTQNSKTLSRNGSPKNRLTTNLKIEEEFKENDLFHGRPMLNVENLDITQNNQLGI
jgi:hypothetical protein